MRILTRVSLSLGLVLACGPLIVQASNEGTSSALALTEPYSARSAALGEAFSAVTNDIAGFGYNPASLPTLNESQASLMYQKGLADDSSGRILFGMPRPNSGLGLSIGYYNGGDAEVTFEDLKTKTVNAKTDINLALGYAHSFDANRFGVTAKYIKSELMDDQSASAYAADLGYQRPLGEKFGLGLALLNLGSKLNYVSEGDNLPRIARAGLSYSMKAGNSPLMFLLDAPYYMNEKDLRTALGVEVGFGPIALRAGYQTGRDLQKATFGAGFNLGTFGLDYSYGLVDTLDSTQRVSFFAKFGNQIPTKSVSKPKPTPREAVIFDDEKSHFAAKRSVNRVYMVQDGDTLKIIALKMYGDPNEWKRIEAANKHLDLDPNNLAAGSRIIIP